MHIAENFADKLFRFSVTNDGQTHCLSGHYMDCWYGPEDIHDDKQLYPADELDNFHMMIADFIKNGLEKDSLSPSAEVLCTVFARSREVATAVLWSGDFTAVPRSDLAAAVAGGFARAFG